VSYSAIQQLSALSMSLAAMIRIAAI